MDAVLIDDPECKNSALCAPAKHHFDECVERVQQQEGTDGPKEDCVEECTCERNGSIELSDSRGLSGEGKLAYLPLLLKDTSLTA